jgi:hypothetical protein
MTIAAKALSSRIPVSRGNRAGRLPHVVVTRGHQTRDSGVRRPLAALRPVKRLFVPIYSNRVPLAVEQPVLYTSPLRR